MVPIIHASSLLVSPPPRAKEPTPQLFCNVPSPSVLQSSHGPPNPPGPQSGVPCRFGEAGMERAISTATFAKTRKLSHTTMESSETVTFSTSLPLAPLVFLSFFLCFPSPHPLFPIPLVQRTRIHIHKMSCAPCAIYLLPANPPWGRAR
ncbi:hypothetical protein XA68_18544 [Ophiocordyceps unilateralis]|uniref:Uncharacterized protein n=1 Tax=Ophiocordyceps unilateralis TaxID=268505 RepID=A0A2A9PI73_OPHUN|nr:hypothetical protein XA68_18544 [Ophiocordyceps unilateralis]